MDRLADRDFHCDSKHDIDRLYAFSLGSMLSKKELEKPSEQ
jgi:hypothetical protein